MSFRSFLGSIPTNVPRSGKESKAIERLKERWSFDSYYETLLKKIFDAAEKEPFYWLKLQEADEAFTSLLKDRLQADGFTVRSPKTLELVAQNTLIISGWASALVDEKKDSASNRALFHFRLPMWTPAMEKVEGKLSWLLGERVSATALDQAGSVITKDAKEDNTLLFLGIAGSGKTMGLKTTVALFLATNPLTRLLVSDLKGTADYDVFSPFCEKGQVIKTVAETITLIGDLRRMVDSRLKYLEKNRYSDIEHLWEVEGKGNHPPVLLVVDEFPQLTPQLKWEISAGREGTAANDLTRLLTVAKMAGVYLVIGSGLTSTDAIPSNVLKFMRTRVVFRTGSESESVAMLKSPAAFWLGKNSTQNDNESRQVGYAYVDTEKNLTRFHEIDGWFILSLLLSAGCAPVATPTLKEALHAAAAGYVMTEARLKRRAEIFGFSPEESEFDRQALKKAAETAKCLVGGVN